MRFVWLAVIAVGVPGVILYLVADYDYSKFIVGREALVSRGLRGWASIYHEHNLLLLVAPIVLISGGVIGFSVTLKYGLKISSPPMPWLRPVAESGHKLRSVVASDNLAST